MAGKHQNAISYRPELYDFYGDPDRIRNQDGYYGEFKGYEYDPYTQRYKPSPKADKGEPGQGDPKEPSTMDTVAPIAGAAIAQEAGRQIATSLMTSGGSQAVGQGTAQIGAQAGGQAVAQGGAQAGGQAIAQGGAQAATQTGTTATTTTTASTGSGVSAGAIIWPMIIAAAIYGRWDKYKQLKAEAGGGKLTDEEIGRMLHPDVFGEQEIFGDKFNALEYSPVNRLLKATIGSGKDDQQIKRDRVRRVMEKLGYAEKNEQGSTVLTLSDGSQIDIGRDGIKAGSMGEAYNIDLTDPRARKLNGWAIPLVTLLTGKNPNENLEVAQMAGQITNQLLQSKNPEQELSFLFDKANLDPDTARDLLTQMEQRGALDEETRTALQDAINQRTDPTYDFGEKPWWEEEPEIPEYAFLKNEKQKPEPEQNQALAQGADGVQDLAESAAPGEAAQDEIPQEAQPGQLPNQNNGLLGIGVEKPTGATQQAAQPQTKGAMGGLIGLGQKPIEGQIQQQQGQEPQTQGQDMNNGMVKPMGGLLGLGGINKPTTETAAMGAASQAATGSAYPGQPLGSADFTPEQIEQISAVIGRPYTPGQNPEVDAMAQKLKEQGMQPAPDGVNQQFTGPNGQTMQTLIGTPNQGSQVGTYQPYKG
jgi:hypothetical protein